jgi:hypothetical protein
MYFVNIIIRPPLLFLVKYTYCKNAFYRRLVNPVILIFLLSLTSKLGKKESCPATPCRGHRGEG